MNLFETLRWKQTTSIVSFASHCTPLNIKSEVPGSWTYIRDTKLFACQFDDDNIKISSVDINKAYRHDEISIRMLKIHDLALIKPLFIIFINCVNHLQPFPDLLKKSNICPIHKKGDKRVFNSYKPVLLLPIYQEVFERLIFSILCLNIWKNTNYFQPSNLVFNPIILV